MSKIILTGQEAREKLKIGLDKVADCVKVTLGPSGRNAVLGRLGITPIITNDGVSIARNIELEDEIEELGAMIVKEASTLADIKGGDGTTTTTVLLQAIVSEVFERLKDNGSLVGKKVDTIKLKKEIDRACDDIVEALRKKAKMITKKDIYDVALISVEYEWLAEMVSEVFEEIGIDGYVTIEEGIVSEYEVFNGIEIPAGYQSEYFINNEKRECIIEDAPILITNQKLENPLAIMPIIEDLVLQNKKELVIIAPEFSKDLLNRLVTTKLNSGVSVLALRLPTFDKDDTLQDIAILTGGKLVDKNIFTKLEDFNKALTVSSLGKANRAVISEDRTMLMGGVGDTKDRVKELKAKLKESQSEFDKDLLGKRIACLTGGIAVIRIGGDSDSEKNYYKLKLEDAVNAVQKALEDGVVKGGGMALKEVSEALPQNILTNAIKTPYEQIQLNSGGLEIGPRVFDPVAITISSLKSACSLAGMLITTEVAVAHKNDKSED